MPKAKRATVERPDEIRNDVLAPTSGPIYRLVLGEDDVEKLAHGRCSRALIEQAWSMLSWKREADQAWEHYDCPCPTCHRTKA